MFAGIRLKSVGNEYKAITQVAASTQSFSSEMAVDNYLMAYVHIYFAKRATSASTAPLWFRVDGAAEDAPVNNKWFTLAQVPTAFAATNSIAVNGTCNSGQKVIAMTNTTGFVAGGIAYVENSTLANSEWVRIASVSANTSITIEENLVNAQTGSTVYSSAEMKTLAVPIGGYKDLRVVADGSLFTQAYGWACKVNYL